MIVPLSSLPAGTIVYPDSDGKRMSDNTKQARWIVTLFTNLLALYSKAADVFIAADLLWYAVEGEPTNRQAPDVLVVFGRPKGDRGSYRQWEENDIPVTVAFEILSPGNTDTEMEDKLAFYDNYGVEEYYIYDPDKNHLMIHVRRGTVLRRVRSIKGFVSPRLGISFKMTEPEMTVYGPDGQPFLTPEQVAEERALSAQLAKQAERRADKAERAQRQAEKRAADALAEVERLRRLLSEANKPGNPE
jgi:Uma2 family endonuclease